MNKEKWAAFAIIVLGMLLPVWAITSMVLEFDLVQVGVPATIIDVSSGKTRFGYYHAEDGSKASCRGYFEEGDTVIYDPSDRSRCRPDWAVGGFDTDERFWLSLGGFLVLVGIMGLVFERYMTGDDELERALRGELPAPGPDQDRQASREVVPEEESRW